MQSARPDQTREGKGNEVPLHDMLIMTLIWLGQEATALQSGEVSGLWRKALELYALGNSCSWAPTRRVSHETLGLVKDAVVDDGDDGDYCLASVQTLDVALLLQSNNWDEKIMLISCPIVWHFLSFDDDQVELDAGDFLIGEAVKHLLHYLLP